MSKLVQDLVKEIQEKNNITSARQVALSVDIEDYHLNKMMKNEGKPNAVNYLKLAKKAGWNIDKALEKIEAGNASIFMLIGLACLSGLYFIGITQTAPVQALAQSWTAMHCILCKIKNRIKKLFSPSYGIAYS